MLRSIILVLLILMESLHLLQYCSNLVRLRCIPDSVSDIKTASLANMRQSMGILPILGGVCPNPFSSLGRSFRKMLKRVGLKLQP